MRRALPAILLILAGCLITACGNDPSDQPAAAVRTAGNGDTFNDADVSFASDMIQHHAQALQMVDTARGRKLDPQVLRLIDDIQTAQVAEIEQLTDWLTAWDQPIPATARDHTNAENAPDTDDMDMGQVLPGMMTADQMDDLANAADAEFQSMWLTMMIQHHKGALAMARSEEEHGENTAAVDLAKQIQTAQTSELGTMEAVLTP